jgi:hypothetical protein
MLPFVQKVQPLQEDIMLVRRRTWFYRLAGEQFAHAITFKLPLTSARAKEALLKAIGKPAAELWVHGS